MKKTLFVLLMAPAMLFGQNIITVAGNGTSGYSGDGTPATTAKLNSPSAATVDGSGNIFIADYNNNAIRKVSASGIISTIAGNGSPGYSGDGGPATAALLRKPNGIITTTGGNIYFCDYENHCVRKIDGATGVITTIAGTGTAGYSGDGMTATAAQLNYPITLAIDGSGSIYICDAVNHRIRKISSGGTISTVAGTGVLGFSGDGGAATAATMNYPYGVAVDATGNIYVSDQVNHRIRKISATGIITTICGTGSAGYSGDGGPATAAGINNPTQVWLDAGGNLLFADRNNHAVRKINLTTGVISAVAGNGTMGASGDGGPATAAMLNDVSGVSADAAGNIYVADFGNNRIRKISATTHVGSTQDVASPLTVFPNPAASRLHVSGMSGTDNELTITNALGQVVRTCNTSTNNIVSIDVSDLAPGFYIICTGNGQTNQFLKN